MNKSLRQNWKIWNHVVFHPLKDTIEIPQDKKEMTEWAEATWKHLVLDDIKREGYWINKSKGNKYNITVWSDDNYVYLVQVLRTEYNTDHTTVYMNHKSEDNLNDLINIAKFMHKNINNIINQSRLDVKQFNELVQKQEALKIAKEHKHIDGIA